MDTKTCDTIGLVFKVVFTLSIIFFGLHLNNLVVANKDLLVSTQQIIQNHEQLTAVNKVLNEQQIELLQQNQNLLKNLQKITASIKAMNVDQLELLQQCEGLIKGEKGGKVSNEKAWQ